VIHRDVKSHNVLLDGRERCKLCDFGLVDASEATAGTPNYMAPALAEQSTA
jgi:serine/threonine protein kinase